MRMMQLVDLQITLMELLSAYEAVLGGHGILVAEDSYYYRLLLKLNLDPGLDWWTKFQNVCRQNRRCVPEDAGLLLPVTLRSSLPAADTGSALQAPGAAEHRGGGRQRRRQSRGQMAGHRQPAFQVCAV